MRSSIACQKCRRSKVRCVNSGVGTTCEACQKTGRVCEYPAAGSSTETSQRRQSITTAPDGAGDRLNGEGPPKKRQKKLHPLQSAPEHFGSNAITLQNALDPLVLTPQVWTQLFEIFEQHFATDLPFLHPPTFLKRLRKSDLRASQIDPSPPLLLGFLSLTAPFHASLPSLLQKRIPHRLGRKSVTYAASDYFAEAAWARIREENTNDPKLEIVQALLMLGLQEWRMSRGEQCWDTVGLAIRKAQILGLQYEAELDNMKGSWNPAHSPEASEIPKPVAREIRRRTYWSCFIMDRYISSGKHRSQTINAERIRIQLPCSESAFRFGQEVKTMMLKESDDKFRSRVRNEGDVKIEWKKDEDTLALFIRAMDLFGAVQEWSCCGGRRQEELPPWDSSSQFYDFEYRLSELQNALPDRLVLNHSNTEAHSTERSLRDYVMIHAAHTLCNIALHREYVPFIPWRCKGPEGPEDEPTLPEPPQGIKYWEDRARTMWKSTSDFNELMSTCNDLGVSVITPLTGFATYTVVVDVLYCHYFPQMDQDHRLCKDGRVHDPTFAQNWSKAWGTLSAMRDRLMMAFSWCIIIKRLNECFVRKKKEVRSLNGSAFSPESSNGSSVDAGRSLAEGGAGLLEYITDFEKDLKDFGILENKVFDTADTEKYSIELQAHTDDGSETGSPAVVKSEVEDSMEHTPETRQPHSGWNSINPSAKTDSESGTPGNSNGHTNGFAQATFARPSDSNPAPPHNSYHPYASPPNDNRSLAHHSYPTHNESAQRATLSLNHHVGNQNMDAPSVPQYPSQEDRAARLNNITIIPFGSHDLGMFSAPNPPENYSLMPQEAFSGAPVHGWVPHMYTNQDQHYHPFNSGS